MSDLEMQVRSELGALDATATAYACHLSSGQEIAVRADRPVDTLSVIKIPVLVLAFRDVAAGALDLDERCVIGAEDLRNGTGTLKNFEPGLQPTFRDVVTHMIITSDNTATDLVVGRVGFERINGMLDELGYAETRLQSTLASYFRRRWELLDEANAQWSNHEVFKRGFPRDEGAYERDFAFEGEPSRWLGRSTAREMSQLLIQIQNAELVSREHSDQMIDILKRQTYGSRLPRRLEGTPIGHKTGDWSPYAGNDVGIIYSDNGPIVVSVFVNQNRGNFDDVEEAHGRVAELLLENWGRA